MKGDATDSDLPRNEADSTYSEENDVTVSDGGSVIYRPVDRSEPDVNWTEGVVTDEILMDESDCLSFATQIASGMVRMCYTSQCEAYVLNIIIY